MEHGERLGGADTAAEPTMAEKPVNEDVPDPDEGDLDDLDDMLDEFSTTKLDDTEHAKPKSGPAQATRHQEPGSSEVAAEEFSKQLQDQMAALMGSMDETPGMKKEIEAMMKELGNAADPGPSPDTKKDAKSAAVASGAEEPFQETIRKTMERMQASGEQATAAAKSDDSEDFLAQMMKEMQNGGLEEAGGDEGFNKMLMGMMEQLTNKEILYEPMKELHDKYPGWMEKNKATTKADDLKRYQEQQRLVKDIVERFEKKDYSDGNAGDREFIVERMQQMQAAGSPPADLVGDINAAQDALGDMDSSCVQQ